ncbi:hypothetical protein N0V88_000037 [Collariella sp. IMI 366227]|nr:hypothetical protein N0V88_000037 [Collariella sp. IMI 366227]
MVRCPGSPSREWLHPEHHGDELVYCEAQNNPDDILYHGSDNEDYSSPAERRRRCEEQAHRFLEGKPLFLLSASLRGPFDKKSGWTNPWRSKSAPGPKTVRKRRLPPPKETLQHNESSAVLDSTETIKNPPRATLTLPGDMDYDAFRRAVQLDGGYA